MTRGTIVKPGTRLYATTSECEVIVVRPPRTDVELACAGVPMAEDASARADAPTSSEADPVLIGKRYSHPDSGLEVLCTRGGQGPLTIDGETLAPVDSRPLPASD